MYSVAYSCVAGALPMRHGWQLAFPADSPICRESIFDDSKVILMLKQFIGRLARLMALAVIMGAGLGLAMAQAEPTMNQIYQAAQAGKLDEAQVMVQQVLISHPKSAKAHYVQAELFARQGLASRGRDALLQADKLAPGLPFAKPEAVQALRAQLASKPGASALKEPANKTFGALEPAAPAAKSSFPLGLGLALGGAAIAVAIVLLRKKPAPVPTPVPSYAGPAGMPSAGTIGSGLSGPQTFGTSATAAPGYGQAAYGQPGYGQQPYGQPGVGQPPGSGMGGKIAGGLAAGLAVGAGVMAAQAIGKSFSGNNEQQPAQPNHLNDNLGGGSGQPLQGNTDMGGQNFGINDPSAWEDAGGSSDAGGGGDWDS